MGSQSGYSKSPVVDESDTTIFQINKVGSSVCQRARVRTHTHIHKTCQDANRSRESGETRQATDTRAHRCQLPQMFYEQALPRLCNIFNNTGYSPDLIRGDYLLMDLMKIFSANQAEKVSW